MDYEVCVRSPCPEHAGLGCIACGGSGYLKQWVPVITVMTSTQDQVTGTYRMEPILTFGAPNSPGVLDLLSGIHESP